MKFSVVLALYAAVSVASARFVPLRRASFTLANGQLAIAKQKEFDGLNANSKCTSGDVVCIGDKFATCANSKLVVQDCAAGTVCRAVPLVNSPGFSTVCTTAADAKARIAATGATSSGKGSNNAGKGNAAGNNGKNGTATDSGKNATATATTKDDSDPSKSLTLDPAVIATGFANDGQQPPVDGQAASLTSTNNFINFCKDTGFPISNGLQIKTGSCNPAPMGIIAPITNMPSCKFVFPPNGGEIEPNQAFTIKLATKNLETGFFTNPNTNYFAAPQQLDPKTKNIIGHIHVVIEKLNALDQTDPTDPQKFEFFKGINGKAVNGILSADVTAGLNEGIYRLQSITAAANHQSAAGPVAQRGGFEDVVYFTVKKGADPKATFGTLTAGKAGNAAGNSTAAATTSAAAAKKTNGKKN